MKAASIGAAWAATGLVCVGVLGCPAKEPAAAAQGTATGERASTTAERASTGESSAGGEHRATDALLMSLAEHADAVVSVTTGTEHFGKGLVTLSVFGSGQIEIVNQRSGKTIKHPGKLTAAEVAKLGETFAKAGFTSLKTSGPPRQPGDTPVVFEVKQGSKQLFHRELWDGDRYEQPGLATILKRNDAIVTEITDGELPF